MPKKIQDIFNFEKGIYGNTSTGNIPEGYCPYSENLDSQATGRLRGIKDTSTLDEDFDARMITYDNVGDDEEVLGQDSSKQVKKYDVSDGTTSNIGSATDDFISSAVPQNEELYCGTTTTFRGTTPSDPIWIGYINHNQIWSSLTVGSQIIDSSECKSFADSQDFDSTTSPLFDLEIFNENGTSAVFDNGSRYFYAISLVYDGYQESPLIKDRSDESNTFDITLASDRTNLDIVLKAGQNTDGDIPNRVTDINIYRASNTTGDDEPTSAYRLVWSIPVNNTNIDPTFYDIGIDLDGALNSPPHTTFAVTDASDLYEGDNIKIGDEEVAISVISGNDITVTPDIENSHSNGAAVLVQFNRWNIAAAGGGGFPGSYSGDRYFIRLRDQNVSGPSFEDNTGIPDTLETSAVKYKLSAQENNQLFAGVCDLDEVEQNVNNYIFVSSVGRYSIFNWAENFIRMPEPPRALMGFNGRMYAFSGSDTYVINPNPRLLSIEQQYEGGALNEQCVVKSSFGMFYADKNNIYWHKGNRPVPIGDPILEFESSQAGSIGWQQIIHEDAANNIYPLLTFDPINKRLVVMAAVSSNTPGVYTFDVQKQRWDYHPSYVGGYGAAIGEDGTLYFTDNSATPNLITLFSGSRKNWKIETPKYAPSGDSRHSWFYEAAARATGSPTIKYSVDGGSYQNPGTSDSEGLRKAQVASSDRKAYTGSLLLESASGTDEVDALTLQFRQSVHSE